MDGPRKHLREADFYFLAGEAIGIPGSAGSGRQRREKPRGPAIEERVQVPRTELIAECLQTRRIHTGDEPVVQALKGDAGAP